MKPQQPKHLVPMPWRRTVDSSVQADRWTGADSIPHARFGKRPARWTDDRALLLAVAGALAQAEHRLCELVRDDPAPPAGLVSLFVKDVTRLRREEQMLRDQLATRYRLGRYFRRALSTRRIKPWLQCLARRLR